MKSQDFDPTSTAVPTSEPKMQALQPLHVKRIMVPIDFSKASQKAFAYALRFAQQFGSEIILIHVLEPPADSKQVENEVRRAEEKLQELAGTSPRTGSLYINSTVRSGVATHEIVEAATQLDVDLIITATHGVGGWKQTGMGSTASRVAHVARCPVLIVREKEHDFI